MLMLKCEQCERIVEEGDERVMYTLDVGAVGRPNLISRYHFCDVNCLCLYMLGMYHTSLDLDALVPTVKAMREQINA
jgi:hypothetical protein